MARSRKTNTDTTDDAIANAIGSFGEMTPDTIEESEPMVLADPAPPKIFVPQIFSKEWPKFLLGQLLPHEIRNGDPTCDGLMRLVEEWIGVVVGSTGRVAQAPNSSNGNHACVEYTLVVQHYDPVLAPHLGLLASHLSQYGGVADTFAGNGSRDSFSWRYPSATCETRAKARACRTALRLPKAIAAEEKSDIPDAESGLNGLANTNQFNALNMLCGRIPGKGVNAKAMLVACWKHMYPTASYEDMKQVPYSVAERAIKQANEWIQNPKLVPDSVSGYDKSWLSFLSE